MRKERNMRNELTVDIALIVLSIIAIICIMIEYRRRKGLNAPRTLKPEHMFEIRPFDVHGDLFTFDEFRELLKVHSCSSDNGTGRWAGADGLWFDLRSGNPVRVCPDEVRLGKRPETFFTHIMYYAK
jgi:hypothetical protein